MTGRHLPDEATEAGAVCVRAVGPLTDTDRTAIADFRKWLATTTPHPDHTDEQGEPADA